MKDLKDIFETIDQMKESQASLVDIGTYAQSTGYDIPALQTAYKDYKKTGQVNEAGLGTSLLQGLTFNFSDEIGGMLRQAIPGGDDYDSYVEKQRARYELFKQKNPVLALGGEVLGSLPSAFVPYVGVANSANKAAQLSKLSQVFKGSAVAGLQGGLSGVGSGEGFEDSLEQGAVGTVAGAGLGLGLNVLGATGQAAYQGLRRSPQDSAVARVMQAVDPTDPTIKKNLLEPNMNLANVGGDQAKAKLRALRTVDREASDFINSTLTEEFKGQSDRIQAALDDAFKTDKDNELGLSIMETIQEAKDAAKVAYTDAYIKYSDIASPRLNAFLRETDKVGKYYEDVLPNLRIEYKNKNPEMYELLTRLPNKASDLTEGTKLPLAVLDQMKKDMGSDLLASVKDPSKFKQSGQRAIEALQTELISLTDEATGKAYGDLRSSFAEAAEVEKALQLGKDAGKKDFSAEEIREMLQGLNNAEMKAFYAGVYKSLSDTVKKIGYSRDSVKTLLKSDFAESRLKALLPPDPDRPGEETSWKMFRRIMEAEAEKVRTKNFVMGGSNTADKQREAVAETSFLNDMLDLFSNDGGAAMSPQMLRNAASYLSERLSTVSKTRGLQAELLLETSTEGKKKLIAEAKRVKAKLRTQASVGSGMTGLLSVTAGNAGEEVANED